MHLFAATPLDAEAMARECDYPAMKENPLYKLNFPNSDWNDEEIEIQWMIEGLEQSLSSQEMNFWKVCAENGELMGFAGWTLSPSEVHQISKDFTEKKFTPAIPPKSMDFITSREVTKRFAAERKRVFQGRDDIWRTKLTQYQPTEPLLNLFRA